MGELFVLSGCTKLAQSRLGKLTFDFSDYSLEIVIPLSRIVDL